MERFGPWRTFVHTMFSLVRVIVLPLGTSLMVTEQGIVGCSLVTALGHEAKWRLEAGLLSAHPAYALERMTSHDMFRHGGVQRTLWTLPLLSVQQGREKLPPLASLCPSFPFSPVPHGSK